VWDDGLAQPHSTHQGQLRGLLPLFGFQSLERPGGRAACVDDEDVYLPKVIHGLTDKCIRISRHSDIRLKSDNLGAGLLGNVLGSGPCVTQFSRTQCHAGAL
jgi:hypothetical protein